MRVLVTENILDFSIISEEKDLIIHTICDWLQTGKGEKVFVCGNPHSLTVADADPDFREALRDAEMVVPDGTGIVLASKILGGGIKHRVTGSDIFSGLSHALNIRGGYSFFFLGSTEETLAAIKERFKVQYPDIGFAGSHSPPFKHEFTAEDSRLMVEVINAVKPDVLWVGMTAPKQEKWIYKNREHLEVKFIGAIGAVFDFYAGKRMRAPQVIQKTGMEWLWRLIHEPRRLLKRNLISTPRFFLKVLRTRIIKEK